MLRLIIIVVVLYLLYLSLKGALGHRKKDVIQTREEVFDELVQDPQCKLYIPKSSSVKKTVGGRAYSFCSEECARRFQGNTDQ